MDINEASLQDVKNMVTGATMGSPWPLQQAESLSKNVPEKLNKEYQGNIFVPNAQQMAFLRAIFNPRIGSTIQDWLDATNIGEDRLKVWCDQPGFLEWILNEAERRFAFYKLEWLKVGIQKMQLNVQTWAEMAKIFWPRGIEHNPAEKGSRREKLEQEMKTIVQSREAKAGRKPSNTAVK